MAGFRARIRGAVSAPPPDPDPEPGDLRFTIPTNGKSDLNMTAITAHAPEGNTVTVAHSASSPVTLRYPV